MLTASFKLNGKTANTTPSVPSPSWQWRRHGDEGGQLHPQILACRKIFPQEYKSWKIQSIGISSVGKLQIPVTTKVMGVGTTGKLISSACYDKQQVCVYL